MWPVLEISITILVALLIVTQVIIPPLIDKRLFWSFRKLDNILKKKEGDVIDVKTIVEIVEKDKEIEELKKKLNKEGK